METKEFSTDVLIIGHGLSSLVTAYELTKKGIKVCVVDQEGPQNLGGQAFWSFGGLFLIDSPEQRKMGIKDSYELAFQDWMGTAAFDREEDHWPKKWAEAYLRFAASHKRAYLRELGITFFPIVGWAERGEGTASGHGNSVPRFHIAWGTGTGVVAPFVQKAQEAATAGLLTFFHRYQVEEILLQSQQTGVTGAKGVILAEDKAARGQKSNREVIGQFHIQAKYIVLGSGGIGANEKLVRQNWPSRLGLPPKNMICGVPDYVDGQLLTKTEEIGAKWINKDRMWHYTEGIINWNPIWSNHAIRILPGPSSMWFDAAGKRLPAPYLPGFDTMGTLAYLRKLGYEHSWFILTQKILKKEFALSGSEQNPDLTNKDWKLLLNRLTTKNATGPVEAFKTHGADFLVANTLAELVTKMNKMQSEDAAAPKLDFSEIEQQIVDRDRQVTNEFGKDFQVNYIRSTRKYWGDKLIRTAKAHRILDPQNGPLIAVRLHILTRKTLGGFQTNLNGAIFDQSEKIIPGLFAVGEASGFGGGGMHGYRALEGTFLGGCIFTGYQTGQYIASEIQKSEIQNTT